VLRQIPHPEVVRSAETGRAAILIVRQSLFGMRTGLLRLEYLRLHPDTPLAEGGPSLATRQHSLSNGAPHHSKKASVRHVVRTRV
jgi:hypothetical protein